MGDDSQLTYLSGWVSRVVYQYKCVNDVCVCSYDNDFARLSCSYFVALQRIKRLFSSFTIDSVYYCL